MYSYSSRNYVKKNFIGNITLFLKENRKIIDCIRMYKNVIYFMFALQQYLLELLIFRDFGPCNKPFFKFEQPFTRTTL